MFILKCTHIESGGEEFMQINVGNGRDFRLYDEWFEQKISRATPMTKEQLAKHLGQHMKDTIVGTWVPNNYTRSFKFEAIPV
jgi:hypothetical protein